MEGTEKSIRDEIAMSMPHELIPVIDGMMMLNEISEKIGFGIVNKNDPINMLDFSLNYQSFVRYRYADTMLIHRNIDPSIYEL